MCGDVAVATPSGVAVCGWGWRANSLWRLNPLFSVAKGSIEQRVVEKIKATQGWLC